MNYGEIILKMFLRYDRITTKSFVSSLFGTQCSLRYWSSVFECEQFQSYHYSKTYTPDKKWWVKRWQRSQRIITSLQIFCFVKIHTRSTFNCMVLATDVINVWQFLKCLSYFILITKS